LGAATRSSVAFPSTGFVVLREKDSHTSTSFRCGTIKDRFTQLDMLHVDVCWRGLNVLVDPGSYLYNGPPMLHAHFHCTASHNTVQVDGLDQMVHHRKFKFLHRTRAELTGFRCEPKLHSVEGQHHGFGRERKGVVHLRRVYSDGSNLWLVQDVIAGRGKHRLRLHWLLGDFPWRHDGKRVSLSTDEGAFSLCSFGASARIYGCGR
jgi:asparagine synthase (glutamine-hydrolysing)